MKLPPVGLRSAALCFSLFTLCGCSRTSSWPHPYSLSLDVSGLKHGQVVTVAEWSFHTGQQTVTVRNNGRGEFPRPLYAYVGHAPIPVRIWIVEQPAHDKCGFKPPPAGESLSKRKTPPQSSLPAIAVECARGREQFPTRETVHPWRSDGGGGGLSMYAVGLGS